VCGFTTISVGSGTDPTTVECDDGTTVVTVTTTTDVPIVISPGNPALIDDAGTNDVVSAVVDVRLLDGGNAPETEICLTVSSRVNDDSCLAFIDESKNPPEWRCEDSCLDYDSDSSVACGTTDHFTNFAILLDGGSAGGDPCGSSTNDFITGVWWGDLTLAASLVACCCCFGIVFIALVSLFPPAQRLFRGSAGVQAQELRSLTTQKLLEKSSLRSEFDPDSVQEGNI